MGLPREQRSPRGPWSVRGSLRGCNNKPASPNLGGGGVCVKDSSSVPFTISDDSHPSAVVMDYVAEFKGHFSVCAIDDLGDKIFVIWVPTEI